MARLEDQLTIWPWLRWTALIGLVGLHVFRVYSLSKGKSDWQYAVVTYILALIYVNHFFLFLTPA